MEERQDNTRPATPAHSPTPWRVTTNKLGYENCIVDANGLDVAECWGGDWENMGRAEECAKADAELICEAVNAHGEVERLRKDYAEMNSIAANLQQSRAKIIEDNDRLRELLRQIRHEAMQVKICNDADMPMSYEKIYGLMALIVRFANTALGEEAGDE